MEANWILRRQRSAEDSHFLPPDVSFPVHEWVPRSGCSLVWRNGSILEQHLGEKNWTEFVFFGDSRERELFEALGVELGGEDVLRLKTGSSFRHRNSVVAE